MSDVCPAPSPDDPLVGGLLRSVDCNVQAVVQTGYASLFQPGGAFVDVLTVLLTLYVAFIGLRLLLGRSPLNITDLVLTTVKLGAVLALATQWSTYQALVYNLLFYGPEQIANVILHGLRARGSVIGGDVYSGLQRAFDDMTAFSPATPPGAPAVAAPAGGPIAAGAGQLSTLLSKAGFDSLLLLGSAVLLLLCSLGVLLASKIVLAILLALGPLFIALLLFESTQGLFQGWLRASLGFAFAPLATTLTLGLALTLLAPSLAQLETMRDHNAYLPGVAFAVTVLVVVFAAVSFGLLAAGAAIAAGFHPFKGRLAIVRSETAGQFVAERRQTIDQPRADRIAAAAALQTRRDRVAAATSPGPAAGGEADRRTSITTRLDQRISAASATSARLGQASRRSAAPRADRSGRAEPGAIPR